MTQLLFESVPQILLQARVVYWLEQNPQEKESLGINMHVVYGSIACAVLHAGIEIIYVTKEAMAFKTTVWHYAIVCMNGRFGWVPYTDKMTSTRRSIATVIQGSDSDIKQEIYDYDNIGSSFYGYNFPVEFKFTEATIDTLTKFISNRPIIK